MKKTKKFLIHLFILATFFIPLISLADGLVPCTGKDCDFKALKTLVENVNDFVFKDLVIPIAAIMFAYAGFLLVTAGGDTGRMGKAKSIFLNVLFGLVIAAAAWLIVNLILNILGFNAPSLN